LQFFEGMRFDRGYLSELFITNSEKLECVLENALVLIHERRISSMKDLLPVLEHAARDGKSLLIIAEDVEGEALATLTVNKLRGTLLCVAVRTPGFDAKRKDLLEDIAVLTGATALTTDLGIPLANASIRQLGRADKVIVTKDETTIIGGGGSSTAIQDRMRAIRTHIEMAGSSFDQEKLQERLAMLAGSVAVLRAGGISEADINEERYKLESAMHSARSAIDSGYLVGGGVAMLRAAVALNEWPTPDEVHADVKQTLASALEEPIRVLIENAKRSPTQVLAELKEQNTDTGGFNAQRHVIEDLENAGILDALKPLTLAIQVGFSRARTLLQTGTWDLSTPARKP
jgi:chaperonin GroEL